MSEKLKQKEAAERLGVTGRQIHNLVNEGMPTELEAGKRLYPFPECSTWYIEYKIQAAAPKSDKVRDQLREIELRKALVEVRQLELDLARDESRVVTIDYMEQQYAAMLEGLRGKLLNFSGKNAPQLVNLDTPAKVRTVLDAAIADVMGALVEVGSDPALDEDDDDPADVGHAA